jgi:hypothetical protein
MILNSRRRMVSRKVSSVEGEEGLEEGKVPFGIP